MKKTAQQYSQASGPVINIHVDTRILTFVLNNSITVYPVAIGKPSTPTPPGNWKVVFKSVDPGGPFGVRWMRLSVPWGSFGIHGTNNPKSIGKAVSHGCIRLYNEDVIVVYSKTPIGTPVNIDGVVRKIRTLKLGSKGDDVSQVQQLLSDLGYYTASIDSYFGFLTRQAVIHFKKDQGMKVNGLVGKNTLKALQIAHDLAFS
ncbi:MAG: L,D-transpeptidase [Firmicutes bacterium]|nr:L,D-transpeptidase [Bacillota bacterium]